MVSRGPSQISRPAGDSSAFQTPIAVPQPTAPLSAPGQPCATERKPHPRPPRPAPRPPCSWAASALQPGSPRRPVLAPESPATLCAPLVLPALGHPQALACPGFRSVPAAPPTFSRLWLVLGSSSAPLDFPTAMESPTTRLQPASPPRSWGPELILAPRPRHLLSREDPSALPTLHTSAVGARAALRPPGPQHHQAASTPPHPLRAPAAPALATPTVPRLPSVPAPPGAPSPNCSRAPRNPSPPTPPARSRGLWPGRRWEGSAARAPRLAARRKPGPTPARPPGRGSPTEKPQPQPASPARRLPRVPRRGESRTGPAAAFRSRAPPLPPAAPSPRNPRARGVEVGTFNLYPARSRVNVCSGPVAWAQGQPAALERPRWETYPQGRRRTGSHSLRGWTKEGVRHRRTPGRGRGSQDK